MPTSPKSQPSDLPFWTRCLTVGLASRPTPPVRIDTRVAAGVVLVLHGADRSKVSVWLTPSDETPEAFFRGRETAVRTLGAAPLDSLARRWVQEVCRGLLRVEQKDGWREFLAMAQRSPGAPMAGRASDARVTSGDALLLRITTQCQARCDFCNARGVLEDLIEDAGGIHRALEQAARQGIPSVSFTGGEPTLRADLPGLVASARAVGFSRVDLQTNGIRLARPGVAKKLAEAGLTSIFLSLHSADPALHDAILGVTDAHDRALRGARQCLDAEIEVCVNHVITRDNLHGLESFVPMLADRLGSVGLRLSFVSPQGGGAQHLELMPRLSVAAARIAATIRLGQELGIDVRIPGLCGIPPCLLPEHTPFFDELQDPKPPPRLVTRRQVPACEGCPWTLRCSGFWSAYLDLYGPDELGHTAREAKAP